MVGDNVVIKVLRFITEWCFVIPFLGMLGLFLCAILTAFRFNCDVLGPVSIIMSLTALIGFFEEPISHDRT